MSEALEIAAQETGVIRLFAVNLTHDEIRPMIAAPEPDEIMPTSRPTPAGAERLLGVAGLDPKGMELFPVKDLDGVGLAGYLADGHGVPEAEIAPDRARLAALEGHVLIVLSAAFRDAAVTLTPGADLTLIGTYGQPRTDWNAGVIETPSAAPYSGASRSPRTVRARATRTGGIIVAVFMTLIALFLLWILL